MIYSGYNLFEAYEFGLGDFVNRVDTFRPEVFGFFDIF